MRQYVDWSLLEELTADEAHSRLEEIDVLQPVLFAIEVALAALWRSWGVEPDAVVGHSMGELAAAYVAGAISLDDAARVICYRSQLLRRTSGQGAMAVVGLSFEQAQDTLAGYEDRVSVAVSNSPTSSVLSGDPVALAEIVERLQREGAFCRWVKGANVAGHSPQMDPLSAELVASLEGLQPQAPLVPFYSTVTGDAPGTGAASGGTGAVSGGTGAGCGGTGAASGGTGAASAGAGAASGGPNGGEGPLLDACYWGQNLRKPVLFWTAVQRLLEDGYDLFLEMSPHPTLLSAIRQGFQNLDQEGAALPSLQREEGELAALLGSLGTLHTLGYPVQWGRLVPAGGQVVRLPSYPWQRERYWLEPEETAASPGWGWSGRGQRVRSAHPLLGRHIQAAYPHPAYPAAAHHIWEVELDRHSLPYLDDHRVQGAVLMPGAAYLEMGQAVAAETFGEGPHTLAEVEFHEPLFLPEAAAADGGLWSAGSRLRLQVVLAPEAAATLSALPGPPPPRE
jgi:acyl transferase domain-containing protein